MIRKVLICRGKCKYGNLRLVFNAGGVNKLLRCKNCGTYWSRLWRRDTQSWTMLEGNYVVEFGATIFILAGNIDEYRIAKQNLLKDTTWPDADVVELTESNLHLLANTKKKILLVAGHYAEREEILSDRQVMNLLNTKEL